MKYIIKNCPCVYKSYRSDYDCDYDGPCEGCTDCLPKRIVEKCKQKAELLDYTAIDILSMLEIEEWEE